MSLFILIHGAWMGSWVWRDIEKILINHGHKVITPDLTMDLVKIKFNQYINYLTELINNQSEKVTLVGHSMAGMIISALAELAPNNISHLVYLCAFLPQNGESIFDIIRKFQVDNKIEVTLQANNLLCIVKDNFIEEKFFNCCSKNDVIRAKSLMRPQSTRILYEKVKLSNENFGSIKKSYIKCTQDNIIHSITQNKMIKRQSVDYIYSMDTDHCPFFSKIHELIQILLLCS